MAHVSGEAIYDQPRFELDSLVNTTSVNMFMVCGPIVAVDKSLRPESLWARVWDMPFAAAPPLRKALPCKYLVTALAVAGS